MDPVELVAGRETAGDASLAVERYQYRYLFASRENRDEFLRDPERYEIQLGGACGRMGLLSGEGDPERYAVHEGRIYIFASDACRNTFLKDPARVLETDDPAIRPTPDEDKEGRAWLGRAVEAMGGAARLDAVKSFRRTIEKKVTHNGKVHVQSSMLVVRFPGSVRTDEGWDEQRWTRVETPGGGWYDASNGEGWEAPPAHRRAMLRKHYTRHPVTLLRLRNAPGFSCAYAGEREFEHAGARHRLALVRVHHAGLTCTLGIDAADGVIRTMSFRGFADKGLLGEVATIFVRHREVDGLRIPSTVDADDAATVETMAIDEVGVDEWFARP